MDAPCASNTSSKLCSSPPSKSNNKETMTPEAENPTTFLRQMLGGNKKRPRTASSCCTTSSDNERQQQQRIDDYDFARVNAVRSNDIAALRSLLEQGKSLDACNRTGETLLHLACRRGNRETVEFLLQQGDLDVHVQDDLGRTVLHDVCWRPVPSTDIMDTLIRVVSPDFLLLEDARGHSCFDYCRKEHWGEWMAFLKQHQELLQRRFDLIQSDL